MNRCILTRGSRVVYVLVLLCAPSILRASSPCDELALVPLAQSCPENLDISSGGSVDGWTVWVGRLCLAATVADVARLLLDDARACEWRDCESVCLVRAADMSAAGAERCNQTTFTKLERRLLAVIRVRLGSLTDRIVHYDAGKLTIEYKASAGSSGSRYGVPVVTRSNAVFTVESVATDRVLVQYCQWAIPPPVLGITSTRIGNRGAKKNVRRTLNAMARRLGEQAYMQTWEPPYLSCIDTRAPVCPAE